MTPVDAAAFRAELLMVMENENYTSGESSPSEMFVQKTLQVQGPGWTMEQLERISDESSSCAHTLIGILHILSHFAYHTVRPFGPRTAEKLLRHESEAVRDFAVKAFENWESREGLPVLRSVTYDEPWLQEYLAAVIAELECAE